MVIFFILILIGFFMLSYGANILIEGSSLIGKRFGIPEIIIGLTIISIGTSLPEFIITLTSAVSGSSDISIGNIVGSCICNLLLVLGATATIKKIPIDDSVIKISLPISYLSIILLFFFGNIENKISKSEGILLILFSLIFLLVLWNISKNNGENYKIENKEDFKFSKNIFKIILGIFLLKYGGDFVVDNSVNIAKLLNISETFIGLTVLSIGTSLPELVTSIIASKKGETDLILGNVFGSNIFNILLILGSTSIIKPINYSKEFNYSLIILLMITFFIWFLNFWHERKTITKYEGKILLLMYLAYLTNLIVY